LTLDVRMRRHLYLFFKEAINNIVRHSGATAVGVQIRVTGSELELRVEDNGAGFNEAELAPRATGGNGLVGLRHRAAELAGSVSIESRPGHGTVITLVVPLH
ncbi:MAG: sensor histidine kinase, partial [Acidobacteriota bacterium]